MSFPINILSVREHGGKACAKLVGTVLAAAAAAASDLAGCGPA